MTRTLLLSIATIAAHTALTSAQAPPPNAIPARNPIFISPSGADAEPVLFRDVSLSTYDLLTGSLQFEKTDTSAKATFAPFKLRESYTPVLSEIGLNFSQAKGVTTFGAGAAYNPHSAFSTQSNNQLLEELKQMKTFRSQLPGEDHDQYLLLYNLYYKNLWYEVFDTFYSNLAKNAVIVSAAANVQTFGTLGGDHIDVDQDGKVDNFYNQKGYDISATVAYSVSQATGFTASAHYGKKRMSAIEGQTLETYPGWSVSFAQRVKLLNPNYKKTDDYLKSLFIPGIVVGASVEWQQCGGTATTCQDALESQYALTPFVDIKATPTAQFRIGIPIQRTVTFGKISKIALAPAIQYVLQLSGTK
jgi:hypothetical protein